MYDSYKVNQQMLHVIVKNKINFLQTSVVSLGRLYAKKLLKKKQHNMYSRGKRCTWVMGAIRGHNFIQTC